MSEKRITILDTETGSEITIDAAAYLLSTIEPDDGTPPELRVHGYGQVKAEADCIALLGDLVTSLAVRWKKAIGAKNITIEMPESLGSSTVSHE